MSSFSYADAMKNKKRAEAAVDRRGSRQNPRNQPPPNAAWGSSKPQQQQRLPGTNSWGSNQPQSQQQVHQLCPQTNASGEAEREQKTLAATSNRLPQQPNRPSDVAWGKSTSTTAPVQSNTEGSVWTTVSNQIRHPNQQAQKSKSPDPCAQKKLDTMPPKILRKNASNRQQSISQLKKPQQQQPAVGKKSKNPKSQLKSMSIGDMLGNPVEVKSNQKSKAQQQFNTNKQTKLKMDSVQEFPALGSPSARPAATKPESSSKSAPSKGTWSMQKTSSKTNSPPDGAKIVPSNGSSNSGSKKKKKKATKANNETPATSGLASFFQPLARYASTPLNAEQHQLDGEEHQLLRLMQERNVYQKKGRQRVAPRKKKFTALKKKVLQERLDKWRKLHPETAIQASDQQAETSTANGPFSTICVYNFTTPEELEDDDEYEEIVQNLRSMASKIGPVAEILVPREQPNELKVDENSEKLPVFLKFEKEVDAAAAQGCWNDLVVGGRKLSVVGLNVAKEQSESKWLEQVIVAERARQNVSNDSKENATDIEICLENVLTDDDYEDSDCMEETLGDLGKVAGQYGNLMGVSASNGEDRNVVLTYHCNFGTAEQIVKSLNGTVVGGESLCAFVKTQDQSDNKSTAMILLENILTEDDLEDKDCLIETLSDIKELCQQYGKVADVGVNGNAVKVTFSGGRLIGEKAASELNGMILGGHVVAASLDDTLEKHIDLRNVLTQDDLEDEDGLEESLADIRELASKYGVVSKVELMRADDSTSIRIHYDGDPSVASQAAKSLDGMVIGGQICSVAYGGSDKLMATSITASESSGDKRKSLVETKTECVDKKARTDDKAPLYSGDKLIPERFAEMKRVPKVPNTPGPRDYADKITDEKVKPLLIEMLGELMRLQKRAIEDKNAKARRRLVMGLREVARGIRAHKVKMIVMANNLDQYGAIDEKLQEIIDLAKSEDVPLFFEFTKRSLGKAIGKNIKIAVVGIQSADGAHQQFKKLNAIATRM